MAAIGGIWQVWQLQTFDKSYLRWWLQLIVPAADSDLAVRATTSQGVSIIM